MRTVNTKKWLTITANTGNIDALQIDLLTYQLFAAGGKAVNNTDPLQTLIYLEEPTQAELQAIVALLDEIKITYQIAEIANDNWTEKWFQDWQPFNADKIKIIPVKDEQSITQAAPADELPIYIKPGLGFGTGHHPTTLMLLKLLQADAIKKHKIDRILDLGCGSGILAIAATKLFNIPADAVDIDDYALNNARENIDLNQVTPLINISNINFVELSHSYDLIFANLYAELLIEFAAELNTKLNKNGFILLSGILEELWPQVELAFGKQNLILKSCLFSRRACPDSKRDKEWVAAVFHKAVFNKM